MPSSENSLSRSGFEQRERLRLERVGEILGVSYRNDLEIEAYIGRRFPDVRGVGSFFVIDDSRQRSKYKVVLIGDYSDTPRDSLLPVEDFCTVRLIPSSASEVDPMEAYRAIVNSALVQDKLAEGQANDLLDLISQKLFEAEDKSSGGEKRVVGGSVAGSHREETQRNESGAPQLSRNGMRSNTSQQVQEDSQTERRGNDGTVLSDSERLERVRSDLGDEADKDSRERSSVEVVEESDGYRSEASSNAEESVIEGRPQRKRSKLKRERVQELRQNRNKYPRPISDEDYKMASIAFKILIRMGRRIHDVKKEGSRNRVIDMALEDGGKLAAPFFVPMGIETGKFMYNMFLITGNSTGWSVIMGVLSAVTVPVSVYATLANAVNIYNFSKKVKRWISERGLESQRKEQSQPAVNLRERSSSKS